ASADAAAGGQPAAAAGPDCRAEGDRSRHAGADTRSDVLHIDAEGAGRGAERGQRAARSIDCGSRRACSATRQGQRQTADPTT
ncbi:hypothetical protein LPJ70_007171, partial [Coemansia sp. RSA 2708]